MEFGPSLFSDQLSGLLVLVEACNLCGLDPPTTPVVTACDHCFCWKCMHQFLQGHAKPCPVCFTMLSSDVNTVPTFDAQGVLVLHLPIEEEVAEEVQPNLDGILDWSGTAAFVPATAGLEGEPLARRDVDMAIVLLNKETKFKGKGTCV